MKDWQVLHIDIYERLISLENLFLCWQEFRKEKRLKKDVLIFERNLEENIFALHEELKNKTYRHQPYNTFRIHDPKPRIISKASVRDRLVHHMIFNELYRILDPGFIYHSYASRLKRGTHLAVANLFRVSRKVSKNFTQSAFALKCDIYRFFFSVSHQKLLQIIKNKISDKQLLWLIEEIIRSFRAPVDKNLERERERERESKGLPIGNLSSQIFANIYLNELDQFIKHTLHVKYYFRYADDFLIVHSDEEYLKSLIKPMAEFLDHRLEMKLHPHKISIRKLRQGIDYLGYVVLPHHIVLRTKTKRRMFRKINERNKQSYLGLIKHCNSYKLRQDPRFRGDGERVF